MDIPLYGFYNIGDGIICDEYGNEIAGKPDNLDLLGVYGVATISGVARCGIVLVIYGKKHSVQEWKMLTKRKNYD